MITNKDWLKFADRVLLSKGNPSTKDAKDCNIPFGTWFNMISRVQYLPQSEKIFIDWAKEVKSKLEGEEC